MAEVTFSCDACGAPAGTVRVAPDGQVERRSFTSDLTLRVSPDAARHVEAVLATADGRALHAFDPEIAVFWCPACGRAYCGVHWTTWDVWDDDLPGWRDSIRGRCPEGHERLLED